MSAGLAALLVALVVLGAMAFGPDLRRWRRRRRARHRPPRRSAYDPGRELRAERKAQELLRSVVGEQNFEMYRRLGFIHVRGRGGYGYLLYPHRPVVAFDEESGELLNE